MKFLWYGKLMHYPKKPEGACVVEPKPDGWLPEHLVKRTI
jgi:hypothetical protein